ncbi:DUF2130 domain-containing protein [Bremerella sp.]|uniref:DUF2130 domain-containing protein n=1 Tax=Bremerella sp. TaxID=2795602 RepID=UPI00391A54B1
MTSQIRKELETSIQLKQQELDKAAQSLGEQRRILDSAKQQLEESIRQGVEIQKKQLTEEAIKKARAELSVEIQDRDERVAEIETLLKTSQANELRLRKRERELESRTEQLKLEVAREIDSEREKIRGQTRIQLEEQHQMKDAEKEKQISDLRKQINELKRKAEQGSQQIQGEVQEIALEDLLTSAFPTDNIAPVSKGVRGADAIQSVFDATGLSCGTILWESKRTKNWSNSWLAKARDDQRESRSRCVVVVTEALPDGIRLFGMMEGVWICSWSCARGLAAALRSGLIEVGNCKLAVQGQHEKMELVYNYLAGNEFKQKIEGVVEAFVTMQSDLDSEKRSMQRIWSKREKQIQRAVSNTAGLYGDLQGIIGSCLPTIEGLATSSLTHDEHEALAHRITQKKP